jgi:hypothetical protein
LDNHPYHLQPTSLDMLEVQIPCANHPYFRTQVAKLRYRCVPRATPGRHEKLLENREGCVNGLGVKVPTSFSSNIKTMVSIKDLIMAK